MNDTILRERQQEEARLAEVSEEIRDGRRSANVCDKCGRPVPFGNDSTVLSGILGSFASLFAIPRHLLPVVENGEVVCEGSPSRAQYIEGQPRDKRMSYAYRDEYEAPFREAYAELQRQASARNAENN